MRRTAIAIVMVLAFTACGHSKPAISKDASSALQAKVEQIRVAASTRDAAAVTAELASLHSQVAELRRTNQISAAAAQKILAAAAVVDQNLALIITTTTTTAPPEHGHGKGTGDSNDGGD